MRKTTKVIVGSALTMAMCATLITGATLALFTGEDNVNIAVTSGKVDVQASVTAMQVSSNAVTDDYNWQEATADGTTLTGNFTETGGTATYSVEGSTGKLTLTNIAPGDAVKFTLSITNNSNILIKYQIRMPMENKYVGGGGDPAPESTLSSKLEISGAVEKTGVNYAGSAWSSAISGTIPESDIIIRLPRDAGNDYASKSCNISLTVLAVQSNARETSYCDENGHEYRNDACIYCGAENPFKGAGLHEETDDTYTIKGAPAGTTDLYIPGKINGKEVKLAADVFNENRTLESVTIAEGITDIPSQAFRLCSSLSEVNLPEGLQSIGTYAFWRCPLESLDIPASVIKIEDSAFYQQNDYAKLTSLTLHEGLLEIGASAFAGAKFTELEIPDSVTKIGSGAFSDNSNLKHVIIGTKLTKSTSGVFNGCNDECVFEYREGATIVTELFSLLYKSFEVTTKELYESENPTGHVVVILPNTITTIDYKAFYSSYVSSVTLPNSVTTIGAWAFGNCSKLTNIVIPDSVTTICRRKSDQNAFSGCSALQWVVLPEGLVDFYGKGFPTTATIYFKGAREQWDAKGFTEENLPGLGSITVKCIGDDGWDGDVSKLS